MEDIARTPSELDQVLRLNYYKWRGHNYAPPHFWSPRATKELDSSKLRGNSKQFLKNTQTFQKTILDAFATLEQLRTVGYAPGAQSLLRAVPLDFGTFDVPRLHTYLG